MVNLSSLGLCLESASRIAHLHRRIVNMACRVHSEETFQTLWLDETSNTVSRDACARRTALITFLSHITVGISVYGFVLDRGFVHTSIGGLLTTTWFILGRSLVTLVHLVLRLSASALEAGRILVTLKEGPLVEGEAATNEGIEDAMASVDLEAWLEPSAAPSGYVPVSLTISRYEPRKVLALDFTNGDGLEVHYCFTRNTSSYSPSMARIRLFFYNKSTEVMETISVKEVNSREVSDTDELSKPFESGGAKIIPAEAVPSLQPEDRAECDLHVDFSHSLKPISLAIEFSAKKFPIKISPEAGVLVGPHTMTLDEFRSAEPQFAGMHQSSRRVTIRGFQSNSDILCTAEVIGRRLLSSANVSFVAALSRNGRSTSQGSGEMLLYFSGQTLTGSLLCLISISIAVSEMDHITAEVRVSCDDALFGLALLNQLEKALVASVES